MKNTMKVIVTCAVVIGLALVVGQFAFAAGGRAGFPAMAMQRITRYLQLTPEQQTQARAIFKAAFQQARSVLTPAQRAQLKSLRGQCRSSMKSLNLTAHQRAQMKTIREQARASAQAITANAALSATEKQTQLQALRQSTRQQIMQILTPAQQQQLQRARANRGAWMRALNLTAEQKTQLKGIRDNALAKFRAILTPEQQAKFDQFIALHPAMTR